MLGLAGTADMRELLDARRRCRELALDVYVHRLAGSAAAMTASLGGLDVLVFTGGVGERAAEVRRRTATRLAHLGIRVDDELNASPNRTPTSALVVQAPTMASVSW